MAGAVNDHFIHFFPFRWEDVPSGIDAKRNIICHCALGSMIQVLHACGIDVDRDVPWARGWILEYQLPDGGLNCDEEAYVRPTPRSSMVSTLPPAEALLLCTDRPFDAAERTFLSGVASYLSKRALCRSLSKGRVIDPAWLEPCFPRFYFYDVLRGLRFLAHWAERSGEALRAAELDEALTALDRWFTEPPRPRHPHREQGTIEPDDRGEWVRVPAARSFALLDALTPSGAECRQLETEWLGVLGKLAEPGVVV